MNSKGKESENQEEIQNEENFDVRRNEKPKASVKTRPKSPVYM